MAENNKKVLIITGAISSFGKLAASYFKHDYNLILVDKDSRKLMAVRKLYAPHATVLRFDITRTVDQVALVSLIRRKGGFDYLLHFAKKGPETRDITEIYKVNILGTKHLFNYLYPLIKPNGAIINISASRAHLTPIPADVFPLLNDPLRKNFLNEIVPLTKTPLLAYGWSKFSMACLCKQESGKWGLKRARIINLFPDLANINEKLDKVSDCQEALNIIENEASTPTTPDDLIKYISFLLSDEAQDITGANIVLNGHKTVTFLGDNT